MRFATDFFSDLYQDYKIYYETNRVVAEATDKVWLVVLKAISYKSDLANP